MTSQALRARLVHLVESAEQSVVALTYPAAMPPPALAVVGSLRPLRRFGGEAAAAEADRVFALMPPGYVDVWLHRKADQRREAGVLAEASRRDVDEQSFAVDRLDHLASWDYAQLDPPHADEQPEYSEKEARQVAVAALRHEGLAPTLLGEHLLFCHYTMGSTRYQPVWLGLFSVDGAPHLLVINADTDRLLQPVEPD